MMTHSIGIRRYLAIIGVALSWRAISDDPEMTELLNERADGPMFGDNVGAADGNVGVLESHCHAQMDEMKALASGLLSPGQPLLKQMAIYSLIRYKQEIFSQYNVLVYQGFLMSRLLSMSMAAPRQESKSWIGRMLGASRRLRFLLPFGLRSQNSKPSGASEMKTVAENLLLGFQQLFMVIDKAGLECDPSQYSELRYKEKTLQTFDYMLSQPQFDLQTVFKTLQEFKVDLDQLCAFPYLILFP